MTISPLMDRSKGGVSRSQYEFLARIALPMFGLWVSAFPAARPILSNAETNLRRWGKAEPAAQQNALGSSFMDHLRRARRKSSIKDDAAFQLAKDA